MSTSSKTAGVGQAAPDFTLTNQHGETVTLSQELTHGPIVLVFLRGFV
jgi:peroxiredoxin